LPPSFDCATMLLPCLQPPFLINVQYGGHNVKYTMQYDKYAWNVAPDNVSRMLQSGHIQNSSPCRCVWIHGRCDSRAETRDHNGWLGHDRGGLRLRRRDGFIFGGAPRQSLTEQDSQKGNRRQAHRIL
jgi:hypothetical protein